ncbi:repeat motif-containing gene [Campylobacter jejuni subsp. doylei 269.97]|uniref:Repeat motif-containing protein n=1 Tax=Campylobacter jejuni subsp. doylei (strain ATCC BAA-1458 / RM4099 / 269.97) TaxID=360109 RepID=A7H1J9_CAMJD|nr:repeat motif-containing gene [Campylobacter jejuni subsp. doylei 269.97]
MQGNTVRNYYVSEGVKALFSIYFKDQTEENFIKALNEFNKENQINSQEIKDEALREIKEELSKLATTDLLNARIDTVDAKIDRTEASLNAKIDKVEASLNARIDKVEASLNARIDKVENKLDSFKTEVKTYVIILAVLMFILQPTIFDLIKSIFK